MERDEELIDLGAVAEETKGPGMGLDDGAGEQLRFGLTDE